MLWLWVLVSALGAVMTTNGAVENIDRTRIDEFAIEEVHLRTQDGVHIAAWYLPVEGEAAVVLVPGIGGNRTAMRSRAAFYARHGVASIMPDFRGTGESDRAVVSIGWHERHDIEAAYCYLLARGYTTIGAHGISMGAAAICYSLEEVDDFGWIVLESSYDSIDKAFENRLAMAGLTGPLANLAIPMRVFSTLRMGVTANRLRPVDYIKQATAPTLILAGDAEPELPVADTRALFEACGAETKAIHLFAGAGHENFHRGEYEAEYVDVVASFLESNGIFQPAIEP